MGAELRSAIEEAIERLIAVLDVMDGDVEAEPDEPESDGDDQDFDAVMFG